MERDQVLHAVVDEIKRLGGEIDGMRPAKGGHMMVYWTTADGTKVATTVWGYAGDRRSLRHARGNIRRAAQ